MGELREVNVRLGFPLFVKKVFQYGFGIDANEFLSKSTIEEVDIARVLARDSERLEPQVKFNCLLAHCPRIPSVESVKSVAQIL